MTEYRHIAVIDIGKTNAKLVVLNAADGREIASRRTPNRVLYGPSYPHFDVEGLWRFILDGLWAFAEKPGYDAISITTHGASAVLLDEGGALALPVLDYEHAYPDAIVMDYNRLRPDFSQTLSPRLPGGLNLGAQLHYQSCCFAGDFARVSSILTYPQYWAFRLSGVMACEVTSLGCHTDLWCPGEGRFSGLVDRLGIRERLAPLRSAFDVLGPLRAELVRDIGLERPVPVYCGLHDSNASLLPHLLRESPPFTVISTGTWIIAFAVGGKVQGLDEGRDTLANVDAYGRAVPSARYMGGREFELLTSGMMKPPEADIEAAAGDVIAKGAMLLPNVVEGSGPIPGMASLWFDKPQTDAGYFAAVTLYAAMMTSLTLGLIGSEGKIVVEGPFASNWLYLKALAALSGRSIAVASEAATSGTAEGAALLTGIPPTDLSQEFISPESLDLLDYFRLFTTRLAQRTKL
ncbi:FGGY-family carbohydrate kinase [Allorhizobium sp. BGMRC 0089]|uniref:FGGY-family carbohydrate kinase n=1 Tax=Allorhizobium sonneratiae TaxID=2934936 RepID=UPI002034899A|nr:FGGY-family carbohydrate kinase [Allorhizobium sonneratiae]MCM2292340.1 FGGY-family carbohydrate kinase [Allorhizobium sonneratiae]